MDVTWLGHGCFRLRGKGGAVVTDPYPPAIGLKLQRLDADIVTMSHDHANHNYVQAVREKSEREEFYRQFRGVAGQLALALRALHDDDSRAPDRWRGSREPRHCLTRSLEGPN